MSNIDYTITRHWKPTKSSPFYVRNTYMGDNVLSIAKSTADAPSVTVQYSYDNATWQNLGTTATTPLELTVPKNTKVYLRATANAWANADGYNYIIMQHSHKIGGNIMSLLVGSSFDGTETTISTARAFQKLFYNDTALTDAGNLLMPASTISQYCYANTFYMCTNMVAAPAMLPATALQPYCYSGMFTGCSSLITAPELPATDLKQFCYAGMFSACTSLGKIVANFESWPTNSALTDTDYHATWEWTRYMKADGSFIIKNRALPLTKNASGNQTDAHYIPYDWQITGGEGTLDPTVPFFLEDLSGQDNVFNITDLNWSDVTNLQYSTDAETWTSTRPNIPAGGRVYVRANATKWYGAKFTVNANYKAGGNTMSLFYGNSFTGSETAFPSDQVNYILDSLFKDSTTLVNAKELILPADALVNNAYNAMFKGCTSITAAPDLPATTLANNCYYMMFEGCTSLTTAPALPATTLADNCYNQMFANCTSLTSAPALPAITLAAGCYNKMFEGCSALTTAPELPAVILANNCYYMMFHGCTSLATAPVLPATRLADSCYFDMFWNCTSLTAAPYLPATSMANSCYRYMFEGCSNLASVEVAATTWDEFADNWLDGVAAAGTVTIPAALDGVIPENSSNGIPSGWTKVIA